MLTSTLKGAVRNSDPINFHTQIQPVAPPGPLAVRSVCALKKLRAIHYFDQSTSFFRSTDGRGVI